MHAKPRPERLILSRQDTPIGEVFIAVDEDGALRALDFTDYEARMRRLFRLHYDQVELAQGKLPMTLVDSLGAYFSGDLSAINSLIVETGGTVFQRSVWRALRSIPAGETISYAALAAIVKSPRGMRAVGLANGANPIAIVVPCHRVIGANGNLTGYAGGLARKRWLLEHEGVRISAAA